MNNDFSSIDIVVFASYALIILGVGLWVSRNKKGETKSAEDYFLASKSLPWWAIGASLIAANISAEQFIPPFKVLVKNEALFNLKKDTTFMVLFEGNGQIRLSNPISKKEFNLNFNEYLETKNLEEISVWISTI